jgi:uncharacterized protein (UPF0335 family)
MAHTQTDNLVTAPALSRELGVPLRAIYRLVDRKIIPFEDITEAWHDRRQFRFDVEAVRDALAERKKLRRF